jgi:type III secretion system FlhB-like substrate exporter
LLATLSRLELDDQIPVECYAAVAVVLAWAFRLRGITPDHFGGVNKSGNG